MHDLLLLVPSRTRPGNVARLIEAMELTCRADTHLLVGLDSDDPNLGEYEELMGEAMRQHPDTAPFVRYEVCSDLRFVVPWINHMAIPRAAGYRFIGTIGDDNVPRTEGWDAEIIKSLERQGNPSFCYGDDLYPGRATGTLCCHVFMTSDVVRSLGYMGPPTIKHMYVDPTWLAWGKATSIEFLAHVVIEHMHYSAGKSEMDESNRASLRQTSADLQAFNAYCYAANGLNGDIRKMKEKGHLFSAEQADQFRHELNIPNQLGEPA